MTRKDIIDAHVRIRTLDIPFRTTCMTIPDDVLDFMKDSALKCLVEIQDSIQDGTYYHQFTAADVVKDITFQDADGDTFEVFAVEDGWVSSMYAQLNGHGYETKISMEQFVRQRNEYKSTIIFP